MLASQMLPELDLLNTHVYKHRETTLSYDTVSCNSMLLKGYCPMILKRGPR